MPDPPPRRCNGTVGALGYCLGITHPLMLHIAGEDRFVPPDAQAMITGRLASVRGAETHIYPGADHAFARKDGVRYLPDAADVADRRTVAFLERALKG